MDKERIIALLKKFNLTEYEAKTYLALAQIKTGTAWSISKKSGVPQPKTYGALKNLAEKGFIEIQPGKPLKYRALDPEVAMTNYIERFKEKCELKVKELEKSTEIIVEALKEIEDKVSVQEEVVWIVRGKDNIIHKAREIIGKAEKEVLIAGVRPIPHLSCGDIIYEVSKKLKVRVLGRFGKSCYEELLKNGIEVRLFDYFYAYMVIADDKEVLLVIEDEAGGLLGIWSSSREFVRANRSQFDTMWKTAGRADKSIKGR